MKLFFIRHGETTGDVENRYGGTYDDHLSPEGIEQSKRLAEFLKDFGIEKIYSSSLVRAWETSEILAKVVGCEIVVVPELQERNQYSFLSGMIKEEAVEKYPTEVEVLKDRLNTIEGAESYEDFSRRISDVFQGLTTDQAHDCIAIVSHGGPLRVLFRDILKWGELSEIGDCAYVELHEANGSFAWVRADNIRPEFSVPQK